MRKGGNGGRKETMGVFSVEIGVGDAERRRFVPVQATVDTGATMVTLPASILRGLDVPPTETQTAEFANGEVREVAVGETWVRVDGQVVWTPVVFNDEGTPPLLGAMALEQARLAVDPVRQRLVPVTWII